MVDTDLFSLDDAFQNWLSTTVDIIDSNCEILEALINPLLTPPDALNLTRCDTSATGNIKFSDAFNDYIKNLQNRIDSLEQRLAALGG